jgi:hypothetical protein
MHQASHNDHEARLQINACPGANLFNNVAFDPPVVVLHAVTVA